MIYRMLTAKEVGNGDNAAVVDCGGVDCDGGVYREEHEK